MLTYLRATFRALGNVEYRKFIIGQAISVSGTWMQKLAQAWLVLVLTDSGVMLGVVIGLQQLPMLLLSTVAGSLADRFEKRRILMVTAAAGAVPAAALALTVQLEVVAIWMVMVAAVVQGTVEALDKPARMTLVNDLAGPELVPNAVALNNIVQDSGKLVGPAAAGLLIESAGIAAAFWINAASYLPVIVLLWTIRPRHVAGAGGAERGERGRLRGTVAYVRRRPELAAALGLTAVTGMVAYNWNVLVPMLAEDTFGGSAHEVGLAFSFFGLGGVLGGLALASWIEPSSRRQAVSGAVFGCSVLLVIASPTLPVAYVLMFFVGTASVVYKSTSAALVQLSADPRMRGRVVSLYVLGMNGSTPIGAPLLGWICSQFGTRVGFAFSGVVTLLATGWAWRFVRRRRAVLPSESVSPAVDARAAAGTSVLRDDSA